MRTAHHQTLTRARQRGAALLVMLVLLITGGAYLLVSQLNRGSGRIAAEKKTAAALAQAKEALIGWAVGNMSTPGMLPYPDRRADTNYDGMSDCPAAGIPTSAGLLLGKFPRVGPENPCLQARSATGVVLPHSALGLDVVDGAGEVLWYAVSRNMVSALGAPPVINPDIMNNPQFPWLVVRDQNRTMINNRVAFVLIAPGPPLPGQDRTIPPPPTPPPLPREFLEGIGVVTNADFDGTFDVGGPCPSSMCEDFVMSEPWPSITAPTFNDRLLYVTIDELMPLIEQRVAREVRQTLRNFGALPPAAALGYLGNDCGNADGFLPLPTCECRRNLTNLSCDCPFDIPQTASITYTGTVVYTAQNNQCTMASTSCQCRGEGSCTAPTHIFRCNADGSCAANNVVSTSFNITYRLPAMAGVFSTVTAGCTIIPPITGSMSCNNFAQVQGVVGVCLPGQILTGLPDWFLTSGWKHYMYYDAVPPLLTVGGVGANAVVISTGAPLLTIGTPPIPQTRPSLNRDDYLDSAENRDGAPNFTGVGQPLTNNFNDQAVIVSPP